MKRESVLEVLAEMDNEIIRRLSPQPGIPSGFLVRINICQKKLADITNKPEFVLYALRDRVASYEPRHLNSDVQKPLDKQMFCHIAYMCDEIENMSESRKTKTERWMGFVGGAILSVDGHFETPPNTGTFVSHLNHALKLSEAICSGAVEDYNAALGMIQGICWFHGVYNVTSLKKINSGTL